MNNDGAPRSVTVLVFSLALCTVRGARLQQHAGRDLLTRDAIRRLVGGASQWTTHVTETGQTYYFDQLTGTSSWDPPSEPSENEQHPAGVWTLHTAESGQSYYFNVQTGQSSWELPQSAYTDSDQQDQNVLASASASGDGQDPWTAHMAADGRRFFYNTRTGESSWEKPSSGAGDAQGELVGMAAAGDTPFVAEGGALRATPDKDAELYAVDHSAPDTEVLAEEDTLLARQGVVEVRLSGECLEEEVAHTNVTRNEPEAANQDIHLEPSGAVLEDMAAPNQGEVHGLLTKGAAEDEVEAEGYETARDDFAAILKSRFRDLEANRSISLPPLHKNTKLVNKLRGSEAAVSPGASDLDGDTAKPMWWVRWFCCCWPSRATGEHAAGADELEAEGELALPRPQPLDGKLGQAHDVQNEAVAAELLAVQAARLLAC
jgi:hypothetical protein